MSMLRAGVIGLGVGMRHAGVYAAHPGCELAAVCDTDPAKLARAREQFPDAATFADASAMLAHGLDVVSVASYDDAHHEQILAAIECGSHVYAEKPLCQTRAQARDIHAALAASPGVRLSANMVLRSDRKSTRLNSSHYS